MNRHFELHIALNADDLDLYARGGLPDIDPDADLSCSNCGTDIASHGSKFTPLALVLDSDEHHLLCLSCAAPVTRPRS